MRDRAFVSLIIGATVCSAASGGLAYGFGTAVVPGLDRTDPVSAVTAMGGLITEARSNPAFVLLMAATVVLTFMVAVIAARRLRRPGSATLLAGAGITHRRSRHDGVPRAAQQPPERKRSLLADARRRCT